MGVYRAEKRDGLEPNRWPIVKFADIEADEPFVKGMLDIYPLVSAGNIFEPEREQVKEALTCILTDGLMPAFLELQQIRESVKKEMPVINRSQLYEDLSRKLWKAYKDLTQKTARLIGFKIGFLYDNDKMFREGLKQFRKQNPRLREGFEEFLEKTRECWQNDLARFRNTWLEHQQGDRRKFDKFYEPQYAEALFDAVWRTVTDILPVLLELRLPEGVRLVEQHPDDPSPRWPARFRYDHPAFRDLK